MNKEKAKKANNNSPFRGGNMQMAVLLLFAGATFYYEHYYLAFAELGIIVVIFIISIFANRARDKKFNKYIESVAYDTENAKSNTLMNFPLPIVVFNVDNTRIIWGNELFFRMSGLRSSNMNALILDFLPNFNAKWLMDGNSTYPSPISLGNQTFELFGNIIRTKEDDRISANYMGILYFVDCTEKYNVKKELFDSHPVIAEIILDNLDELTRNQTDRMKSDLRDDIEDRLSAWSNEYEGIIKRFERDRYLFFFKQQHLQKMVDDKFPVINSVHSVSSPSGVTASISVGVSAEGMTFAEVYGAAHSAAELALTRGGDQVAVKGRRGYDFFGGKAAEAEKRTKVKSRVMASTLTGLIKDSSNIIIMGHNYSDMDSLGASVAVAVLARKQKIPAYILYEKNTAASQRLHDYIKPSPLYKDTFVGSQEALLKIDSKSLLVIVDTNRPEQVENEDMILACNRIAVIDHHRAAATSIRNAVLAYVEPYASSVCELMCEILQEQVDKSDVSKEEANAILSGIVLDTKNFTIRTGDRTFDAAAYLKRLGADTSDVKKILQTDMDEAIAKYSVLQSAKIYKGVAVACPEERQNRIVAAQAADELLNISGVDASVVVYTEIGGECMASARSIGSMNVQLIMEKLGGGGNKSAAAVRFEKGTVLPDAHERVKAAIDEYLS